MQNNNNNSIEWQFYKSNKSYDIVTQVIDNTGNNNSDNKTIALTMI